MMAFKFTDGTKWEVTVERAGMPMTWTYDFTADSGVASVSARLTEYGSNIMVNDGLGFTCLRLTEEQTKKLSIFLGLREGLTRLSGLVPDPVPEAPRSEPDFDPYYEGYAG